ncbi:MAG: hypothetical protein K1X39_01410 [Thermoflexales bacterium]|nr:hypothetical protein [Thermoflexales bacterium]
MTQPTPPSAANYGRLLAQATPSSMQSTSMTLNRILMVVLLLALPFCLAAFCAGTASPDSLTLPAIVGVVSGIGCLILLPKVLGTRKTEIVGAEAYEAGVGFRFREGGRFVAWQDITGLEMAGESIWAGGGSSLFDLLFIIPIAIWTLLKHGNKRLFRYTVTARDGYKARFSMEDLTGADAVAAVISRYTGLPLK